MLEKSPFFWYLYWFYCESAPHSAFLKHALLGCFFHEATALGSAFRVKLPGLAFHLQPCIVLALEATKEQTKSLLGHWTQRHFYNEKGHSSYCRCTYTLLDIGPRTLISSFFSHDLLRAVFSLNPCNWWSWVLEFKRLVQIWIASKSQSWYSSAGKPSPEPVSLIIQECFGETWF